MIPAVSTSKDAPDLAAIMQAYSEVTERLKQSHELLAREVCRLREELHQKNKELERRERLAALGEMAAGVAHEIRNPLGGIDLYTSLLERDLADRPEQLSIVRKVRVGVRNMENIVGDILTFAGPSEPNRQTVSLRTVLEGVLAQTAPTARARNIEIETDRRLEEVRLICDTGQIERALLNLILNALEAVGEGGRVWVRKGRVGPEEGLCRILIEDDGPGVDPQLVQRVFDPFFTTKDNGTGLGLAIVHRMAESHGGHVKTGARRGGGASFELCLPGADHSGAALPAADGHRQLGPRKQAVQQAAVAGGRN